MADKNIVLEQAIKFARYLKNHREQQITRADCPRAMALRLQQAQSKW